MSRRHGDHVDCRSNPAAGNVQQGSGRPRLPSSRDTPALESASDERGIEREGLADALEIDGRFAGYRPDPCLGGREESSSASAPRRRIPEEVADRALQHGKQQALLRLPSRAGTIVKLRRGNRKGIRPRVLARDFFCLRCSHRPRREQCTCRRGEYELPWNRRGRLLRDRNRGLSPSSRTGRRHEKASEGGSSRLHCGPEEPPVTLGP